MKIYNKKGFISGTIGLCLSLLGFTLMFIKDFSVKSLLLFLFLLIFSATEFYRSLSKSKTIEDLTINNDERDKYIQLKTSHKSLQIIGTINFIISIVLMIAYGITKNKAMIPAIIITTAYITIFFVVQLCTNIYYENHE